MQLNKNKNIQKDYLCSRLSDKKLYVVCIKDKSIYILILINKIKSTNLFRKLMEHVASKKIKS